LKPNKSVWFTFKDLAIVPRPLITLIFLNHSTSNTLKKDLPKDIKLNIALEYHFVKKSVLVAAETLGISSY
jgi:hypothetical protein